ncbi:hypothetical protein ColLi_03049 [Colletotrichum liriopes]|uniref:Uncharacterized protein n=1 Tax=Colletotrichum liriopes TaxID=708192 RepID=A0AA37GGX9_9PEZI|nr:hypothetical protein ColLi_03049 [Colletotrichum liriopes]
MILRRIKQCFALHARYTCALGVSASEHVAALTWGSLSPSPPQCIGRLHQPKQNVPAAVTGQQDEDEPTEDEREGEKETERESVCVRTRHWKHIPSAMYPAISAPLTWSQLNHLTAIALRRRQSDTSGAWGGSNPQRKLSTHP